MQLAQRNAEVGLIDFVDGRCRRTLSELYDSALERVNLYRLWRSRASIFRFPKCGPELAAQARWVTRLDVYAA